MDLGGRFGRWARAFRGSLLFMPILMTAAAFVLFATTSLLDTAYEDQVRRGIEGTGSLLLGILVFAGSPETATSLLSSVVGTWATIVGVVFSVTLVTIQLSATKYSAQVIPIFERDPLNQVVLGSFTATFVYALLVLKTIRSADEPFVPLIGVNLAVLLALASLFLLIAFIGNLTAYIRPTRFVQDYARRGSRALPSHEERFVRDARAIARPPEVRPSRGAEVATSTGGYVTRVRWRDLCAALRRVGAVERVDVEVTPGMRVFDGDVLLRLHGPVHLEDDARARLERSVAVDHAADETGPSTVADNLADVGVTAMSGGATDVGVAKVALEGALGFAAAALARSESPSAFLVDVDGRDVVVVRERERFALSALRAIERLVDKFTREGYSDLAETLTLHSGMLFRRAASSPRRDAWQETLEWFGPVARKLFGFDDERVQARLVRNMRRVVADVRRDGHEEKAVDLEFALLEAARAAGVSDDLREAIVRHAPE